MISAKASVKVNRDVILHRYNTAVNNMYHNQAKMGRRSGPFVRSADEPQNGFFALLQGSAYGLQYKPMQNNLCYNALSSSISNTELIKDYLKKIYIPSYSADIMLTLKDNFDMLAAIGDNCRFDILINTLTQSIGEGASTTLARIGGAMIYEIPGTWNKLRKASDSFEKGNEFGKLVQITFNWSI